MKEIIEESLRDILTSLYQPFLFAVLMAFLGTFLYKEWKEKTFIVVLKSWLSDFKASKEFRKIFFLSFYLTVMVHKTLYNRNMWANPINDILGGWTFYNSKGEFTTECVQNIVLFIPYIILLFWNFHEKIMKRISFGNVLKNTIKISFQTTIIIGAIRLFFRLGNVRVADMVYQMIGGMIGGIIYYIGCRCQEKGE